MSHYEERLEADLGRIHAGVRELAVYVERAVEDAMKALLARDVQLANMTVLSDNRINRASRRLDRLCHAFIARHLPGAGHLRTMSAVIRINVALERIGDYAVTISRESLQLSAPPPGRLARELDRVGTESRRLLHRAVEAFDSGDADTAAATMPLSENVENMMDDIYAGLTEDSSARHPREIIAAFVVFSLLKRISDQAKNICEQTLFAVAGWNKRTRPFRILFVDGGDNRRSLMAQGIARKGYSDVGTFLSATPNPADRPDGGILQALDTLGIDTRHLAVDRLVSGQQELQEMDVIITLDGPVSRYVDTVPFHSSAIEWDIDADLAEAGTSDADNPELALYRVLKNRIDELIDLLRGGEDDE